MTYLIETYASVTSSRLNACAMTCPQYMCPACLQLVMLTVSMLTAQWT